MHHRGNRGARDGEARAAAPPLTAVTAPEPVPHGARAPGLSDVLDPSRELNREMDGLHASEDVGGVGLPAGSDDEDHPAPVPALGVGPDTHHDEEAGDHDAGKREHGAVGFVLWLLVIAAVGGSAIAFATTRFHSVPAPVPDTAAPTTFSAQRAMRHVKALAEDIGHRNVGTHANEVEAPEYLLAQLRSLEAQATEHGWKVEVSVQKARGTLLFTFLYGFFSNAYKDVTNIVARVSPAGLPSEALSKSLLVSSHYDSTLGTPGAVDAAVGIAVMLETVRSLVHSDPSLPHPVIFNFNGAEETFLQASHGFITAHEWAPTVAAFVNLEGAGSGGPEILFQTGPRHSWLAETYARVCPHPHASVVGQDIFQRDLIPGDTDFRIYRDFGAHGGSDGSEEGAPGFDFAFYHNGHMYHTREDSYENTDPGSVQHMGDNIVALVPAVVASAGFNDPGDSAGLTPVYFDVFGYFLFLTPMLTAKLCYVLLAAAVVGTLVVLRPIPGDASIKGQLASLAIGIIELTITCLCSFGGALVSAVTFYLMGQSMPWYSRPGLIILMYGAPAIGGMLFAHKWMIRLLGSAHAASARRRRAMVGQAALHSVTMLLFARANLGSAYMFAILASCALNGVLLDVALKRFAPRFTRLRWVLSTTVSVWLPAAYATYMSLSLAAVVVPVLGKVGALPPIVAEVVVAIVVALIVVLVVACALPSLHSVAPRHATSIRRSMVFAWFVGAVFAYVIWLNTHLLQGAVQSDTHLFAYTGNLHYPARSITNPYSVSHPKRLIIHHMHEFEPSAMAGPPVLASSSVMVSPFDPNPEQVYVNGIMQGAANLERGTLNLDLPEAITDSLGWQVYFPFSNFLRGVAWRDLPPHPRLKRSPPRVVMMEDSRQVMPPTHPLPDGYLEHHDVRQEDVLVRRRLTLKVVMDNTCWSTLNVTAPTMIGWSFSQVFPDLTCADGSTVRSTHYHDDYHQPCSHMVRHAGGPGTETYDFWLELSSDEPTVEVRLATVCTAGHGPVGPVLELFQLATPEWISPTVTYGTLQSFSFHGTGDAVPKLA